MNLERLTDEQILTLDERTYDKLCPASDGYQPFGWDWPTMMLVRPNRARTLKRIRREWNRRVRARQ